MSINHYCKWSICFSSLYCVNSFPVWAQDSIPNPPANQIETTTTQKIDLKVGEVLRVKVPQLGTNPTAKIAVLLGDTDITSQIEIEGDELVYRSSLVPLNVGSQTLKVFQITAVDRWNEIATFRLEVQPALTQAPTPTTTESSSSTAASPADTTPPPPTNTLKPKLAINVKSQFLENRSPDAGVSQGRTVFDVNFTGGLSTEHQIDLTKIKTKFTIVGTNFQPETLRFAELQNRASQIDLSEYAIELNDGNNQFTLGHQCFGTHPFLLSNLCARGVSGKVKLDRFGDLALARISSTAVVGFENILGFERTENTLESAILGLQLFQNQNAGVRLETIWMKGSRAAVNNFNVGEIVDAEKSEGVGVRVTGNDDAGRFKADAGFANSTFDNITANDPQLNAGLNIVPQDVVNKNAWYAEASYDLVKDVPLGGDSSRTLSMTINARTERIDPQFGTLGVNIQADRLQTQYALNTNIAGATLQFQQNFSRDNIANIPTLLKTDNRNTNINLTVPLQTFLSAKNAALPTLTYSFQQTYQLGSISAASSAGFSNPAQIPDQLNTTQQVGLDWTVGGVNLNYKYITAIQDNRQVGRENADTRNLTHQLSTNWQVTPQFRLNLGYNFVNANNLEQSLTRFTNSPTFGTSWEFIPGTLFAFNYNRSDDTDSIGQGFNRGESLEFLLTHNFKLNSLGQELPGSAFLRFGKQSTLNQNVQNNINTNAAIDTISGGISLSF
jgi:hypothetical protein